MQHGRQRKKRNKIAPTDFGELERPSSAPTNNRTRQWLKEINENRPMTAAPQLSREFVAPQPEKGLLRSYFKSRAHVLPAESTAID